jgi:hypothetical protein
MATAYGFVDLASLFAQRVQEVGEQRIYKAVQESAAEYNRVVNGLMSEFAERTLVAQEQIELPGDGSLQPLDENGNPMPVMPSGSYKVAYPIQGGGTAWGTNRVSREMLTVEEANRNTDDALQRDADWMTRHMLAAVFNNATWTYADKVGVNGSKGLGDITIQPLANADAVVYTRKGGAAAATDTHYLAQAGAIADATNPFPVIKAELMEHPSNGNGRILVYVPANLETSIRGLANFVAVGDTDVSVGANADTLSNIPGTGPGEEVIGKVDGCWIIKWSRLPDNYMIAKVEGKPFLKMREYPAASIQGFFPESANVDGNHLVTRMIRYAGFGVSDRVAALVYRVSNGAYAIPTGFEAPLPA